MRIEHSFDYDVWWSELADEFCAHDSEYQAEFFNDIGLQFKTWSQDKKRTATYVQMLEIAEQLNDSGKWFIRTICEYMDGKSRRERGMSKNINEILDAINAEIQKEKDNISFDINEEKAKWVNSGIHDGLSLAQEIISRYKEGEK